MAKKYKALLLDLDDTVVPMNTDNLSPKVQQAINRLAQKVPVCIVTGRRIESAMKVIKHLGVDTLCIGCNGAVIYDLKQKKILAQHVLDKARVKQVWDLVSQDKKRNCWVHTVRKNDDAIFFDGAHEDLYLMHFTQLTFEDVELLRKRLHTVPNITTHLNTKTYDGDPVLDVYDIHASKQQAISYVLQYFKIAAEDIVAAGDGENDIPMILAAGMGVAMGNAAEGLKSVADWTAPSVHEDGVVKVIEKYF